MKHRLSITTCNTCPFDRSDDRSRSKDHCALLGYDFPAGGFRVPPKECPWDSGITVEVDREAAQKRVEAFAESMRASYEQELERLKGTQP